MKLSLGIGVNMKENLKTKTQRLMGKITNIIQILLSWVE